MVVDKFWVVFYVFDKVWKVGGKQAGQGFCGSLALSFPQEFSTGVWISFLGEVWKRRNERVSTASRRVLKPSLRWGITVACDLTRCSAPLVAAVGDG